MKSNIQLKHSNYADFSHFRGCAVNNLGLRLGVRLLAALVISLFFSYTILNNKFVSSISKGQIVHLSLKSFLVHRISLQAWNQCFHSYPRSTERKPRYHFQLTGF